MQLEQGNMWSIWQQTDLFCITTNATIKADGSLVMGAGIAKQANDRTPGLNLSLGKAINMAGRHGRHYYGLLTSPHWPSAKLAAFQVKAHWQQHASINLIHYSTQMLVAWCNRHPDKRVDLNFPGIGNGNLDYDLVLPIIQPLPDQVHVWTYKPPPKDDLTFPHVLYDTAHEKDLYTVHITMQQAKDDNAQFRKNNSDLRLIPLNSKS